MNCVALAAFPNFVVGGEPAGQPGKSSGAADSSPAQSPGAPGDGFLALLVAGLGVDPATGISDTASLQQPAASHADGMPEPPVNKAAPARGKSKDQINELACVAPPVPPEAPLIVAAYARETPADASVTKTSDNRGPGTTSSDGASGPWNTGPSPTRPITADERGAVGNTTGSAALRPQIAFEALVRAPNAESASGDGPVAISATDATALSAAPVISQPAAALISQPAAAQSAIPSSPAPPVGSGYASTGEIVPPVAVVRKEAGSGPGRSGAEPTQPQQAARPQATALPNRGQQQESPGEQKHAGDDGHDAAGGHYVPEGPAGSGRMEMPAPLGPPLTPAAQAAPSPAPKLQPAGSSVPLRATDEAAATGGTVSSVRDISLQVPNPGGPRVEVQVTDRAGTVHVVVRTEDSGLTRDLRNNLPELTQKLNQQGMEADAWSPAEMRSAAAGHENRGHSHEQSEGQAWSGGSGRGSGGNPHDGRRQSPGESPDEEFDQSFSNAFTGAASWQPVR